MFQLRSGRLQRETSGVDRSQAAILFEAIDLVKEISQTCGRSATVRPKRTLNRRMVTAAKPVYSAWFSAKRRKEWKQLDTLESICTGTALPRACDWRTEGIT